MKKHLKTVALTLTTVSVVTHNQEVFSLVKEPILKQTQASSSISGADYAESSGKSKLKINETSGPVDDTVTDLFSDKRITPEKIKDNLAKGPREQELKAVTENTESEKQINSGSQLEQSKESLSLNKRVPSTSNWEICDFITKGNTLVGLSKSGVEKLSQTDHLVLPSQAADGTQLIQVASFAFTPDKKTAIAEYTSRAGENGEISQLDVDGKEIINEGEVFNSYLLKKVTIPTGYKHIGQDAFVDNKNIAEVNLPESLETISDYAFAHLALKQIDLPDNLKAIGELAFFDNQITGKLSLPRQLMRLAERAFKSNHIKTIEFRGNSLKVIGEASFQDNDLSQLMLPDGLEKIESEAFTGNPGDDHYNNRVVLWTKSGKNPYGLATENTYVNPDKSLWQESPEIDYTKWLEEDFTYQKNSVTGFSSKGLQKVKRNKNLEIPKQHNGVTITEIGDNAFRNVDFQNKTLRKYDLEEVKLPSTIRKIGAFAFQSNNLKSFEASDDLEEIKEGAFMNNRIETLELKDKLVTIGDAAFHINHIYAIVLPESVQEIGRSAFRQNGANNLIFMGSKVKTLGEMAFLSNRLEHLDLSEQKQLTEIPVQAFSDNALKEVLLPASLKTIREEAFKKNHLKQLEVASALSHIAFNALDDNDGDEQFDNKVVVKTHHNSYALADGEHFIVDPDKLSSTIVDLEKILKLIEGLDYSTLRQTTQTQFRDMTTAGKALLSKSNLRQGEKQKFLQEAQFFLGRVDLDKAIAKAEKALVTKKATKNGQLLERSINKAVLAYNNSAIKKANVKRLEKELDLLTGLVEGKGPLAQATMVQGVYLLKTPLPLPEYYIGLNVYFDKSGKLIYALDMSDTIGEGQKDAYGNPILNVDEDNEGYHALAVATLADYEGLDIKTILNSKLSQLTSIRQVPTAAYHRAGIFQAIQNAAAEAEQLLPKPGTHSEKSSSSESANSKDRGLQSNPKTNRGRHSAILPRTGSKGSFVYGILGYTSVALLSLITAIKKKKY
ncbi:TPA: leucine-rich repeat protein [Streptococcus pyogenes]|nr:leucine-rich repeat protein [Streptococcus pyogenes]HER1322776.1 leucine-rich repeat protein [Streptococcus pyogenes]HER1329498.1 leucine-rich repeat protein [Streptococcus pyogenes]